MSVVFPQRARRLPSFRSVNRGHPLIRDSLCFWAAVPGRINPAGGGWAKNEATGEVVTVPAGISQAGFSAQFDDASRIIFDRVELVDPDPLTILAWCTAEASDGGSGICGYGSPPSNGFKWQDYWGQHFRFTAAAHKEDSTGGVMNNCTFAAFIHNNGNGEGFTDYATNGIVASLYSPTSIVTATATQGLAIGANRHADSEHWGGTILAFAMLNRLWDQTAIRKVADDPWGPWR